MPSGQRAHASLIEFTECPSKLQAIFIVPIVLRKFWSHVRPHHAPLLPRVRLPPGLGAVARQRRGQLAVADRVAGRGAGPAAGHAGARPRLRARRVVDLPAPRVRRAGLGHRPVVRRSKNGCSGSATPASRTACSRSTPTPGRCRSPREFFDAIVSIDSFIYYGTDDLYLDYLARFVKPGGQIGIAGSGLVQEIDGPCPSTCGTGGSRACGACTRPRGGGGTGSGPASSTSRWPTRCADGWRHWLDWQRAVAPDNEPEIQRAGGRRGRHLGYVRAVGRRRADVVLDDPIVTIPVDYRRQPVLASERHTT